MMLYRGPLESCNYGCSYCPFAKRKESADALLRDRMALQRFVKWIENRPADDAFSILFTPWGEALTRRWYREALARLSNLPQVRKAAVQTNLSGRLAWMQRCDKAKLALWTTFHPSEVSREKFLTRCFELLDQNVRFSVGIVGKIEHVDHAEALRRALPAEIYVWVNAFKDRPNYYAERPDIVERFNAVDPLFALNNRRYASSGKPCHAGESVVSIDGDGTIRRCHFIRHPIGHLYMPNGLESALQPRPCSNRFCACHIGYVHLPELQLYDTFADGILERIPALMPTTVLPGSPR